MLEDRSKRHFIHKDNMSKMSREGDLYEKV